MLYKKENRPLNLPERDLPGSNFPGIFSGSNVEKTKIFPVEIFLAKNFSGKIRNISEIFALTGRLTEKRPTILKRPPG
jgi:hypothetical protein